MRVAIAKLALELGQFKPAYELLDQLLEEDDRIIEVSHLAAVSAHSSGDHRSALVHVDRALELLATEEADVGMGEGKDEAEEDEDDGDSERQSEEIAASKRALTLLRVECVAGAKTQPADPEEADLDEEEGEEGDDEEEAAGPSSSVAAATAASAGEERKFMHEEEDQTMAD